MNSFIATGIQQISILSTQYLELTLIHYCYQEWGSGIGKTPPTGDEKCLLLSASLWDTSRTGVEYLVSSPNQSYVKP